MNKAPKSLLYEETPPHPEYLVKSIAEQGYSLETSLADLIDNAITAKAENVEILVDTDEQPFRIFIADNGYGMDKESLKENMKFPSTSPAVSRKPGDLGRFGLGMKTASFSQTRRFTVISRKRGERNFSGRTWDVDFLTKTNSWNIIINTQEEVNTLFKQYKALSGTFFNSFQDSEPNTIVIWDGLYKYEHYLDDKHKKDALKKEITEVTATHLSIVFHRYMERREKPLRIRVNNDIIKPFNPFPADQPGFRSIDSIQKSVLSDSLMVRGFVLPARSIDESQNGLSAWTTRNRSLLDMEGIYVYRADRLILYGGWNGIIKKSQRVQLARVMVDVGNNIDHLLHLNVAKSHISIPHDVRNAFERYIIELTQYAEQEYYNRGITKASIGRLTRDQLFTKKPSSKGMLTEINLEFPLIGNLLTEVNSEQRKKIKFLLRMISVYINKVKQVHEDTVYINNENSGLSLSDIISSISTLLDVGFSPKQIRNDILPALGYRLDTIPPEVNSILKI